MTIFFASVECVYDPSLAKQFGIKTAVPIWEAKQLCPSLCLVEPHYERYMDFSRKARSIYENYTDMVEAFGIDECWLDVTGSSLLCGTVQIHIRDTYLGVTEHQTRLVQPTRLASELAQTGMELFKKNWRRRIPVRSIGIRACELMCDCESVQLSFEYDYQKAVLLERLETSVDRIREKYGKNALMRTSLMRSSITQNERIPFLP